MYKLICIMAGSGRNLIMIATMFHTRLAKPLRKSAYSGHTKKSQSSLSGTVISRDKRPHDSNIGWNEYRKWTAHYLSLDVVKFRGDVRTHSKRFKVGHKVTRMGIKRHTVLCPKLQMSTRYTGMNSKTRKLLYAAFKFPMIVHDWINTPFFMRPCLQH